MSNTIISEMTYAQLQAEAKSLGLPSVGVKKVDLQAQLLAMLEKETAELAETVAETVATEPEPTGKLGGNGEFFWFPSEQVFAPMVNGQPSAPSFDQTTWDMVSPALPSVNVAKATVIKAAQKAAEVKIDKYRIQLVVTFDPQWIEDAEDLEGTFDLDDAISLLDRCGHTVAMDSLTQARRDLQVKIEKKGNTSSTGKTRPKDRRGATGETRQQLIDMLREGTTVPEVMEKFNWTEKYTKRHLPTYVRWWGYTVNSDDGVYTID